MKLYKDALVMKFLKIVFIFLFVVSGALSSFSQVCTTEPPCGDDGSVPIGSPGSGPGGTLGPGEFYCCDNPTVPFDGGVSLLIAAGLGIGARSVYKRKKQQES